MEEQLIYFLSEARFKEIVNCLEMCSKLNNPYALAAMDMAVEDLLDIMQYHRFHKNYSRADEIKKIINSYRYDVNNGKDISTSRGRTGRTLESIVPEDWR